MVKKYARFFSYPFGVIIGIIIFIVLSIIITKETGIENLYDILFFVPNILLLVIGIVITVTAIITFVFGAYDLTKNARSSGRHLVVTGIYKYVRHPIYSGLCFTIIGFGIMIASTGVLIAGIIWFLFSYFQALKEEVDMYSLFGKTYTTYKKHTPMFVLNFISLAKDIFGGK